MTTWQPQHYLKEGKDRGVDEAILDNAIATAEGITKTNPKLPPIFTLQHIAHLTNVDYSFLRTLVSRDFQKGEPYRCFRIRKRPSNNGEKRFRMICVPNPSLMRVQRWITQNVLMTGQPHYASVAYARGCTIKAAAKLHCKCRWLIKLDVRNFFESINEISAYRVFRSFGYQPLVAFELTRICTRLGSLTRLRTNQRWRVMSGGHGTIKAYNARWQGHLPQGAPTSPMLSNLAMREFDARVAALGSKIGLMYTRYADDLTFSTADPKFDRKQASQFIGAIYSEMGRAGLSPNVAKTSVAPPGSRKIVLGLLVDGGSPRLSREFKSNMRRHLHFLCRKDIGPSAHAIARGFTSIAGLKHHVQGLVNYSQQIEPDYGLQCMKNLESVDWPI